MELNTFHTVNLLRLQEVKAWGDAVRKHDKAYKDSQKRIHFLEKVINKYGRDHRLTQGEVDRFELDPIQP